MEKFFNRLSKKINFFTDICGKSVAWLILIMVFVQCGVVCLRYLFDVGSIALQESVNYLHACCFMLGAAFTFKEDGHVRVDIFYRNMSQRKKYLVNILGNLAFLIPLCVFILIISNDYVLESWRIVDDLLCTGDNCPIRTTPYLYMPGSWGPWHKTEQITKWDYPA